MIEFFRVKLYASVIKIMEGHSRRNWNTGRNRGYAGKILE
jgi:hypothetical protein